MQDTTTDYPHLPSKSKEPQIPKTTSYYVQFDLMDVLAQLKL